MQREESDHQPRDRTRELETNRRQCSHALVAVLLPASVQQQPRRQLDGRRDLALPRRLRPLQRVGQPSGRPPHRTRRHPLTDARGTSQPRPLHWQGHQASQLARLTLSSFPSSGQQCRGQVREEQAEWTMQGRLSRPDGPKALRLQPQGGPLPRQDKGIHRLQQRIG